jgi:hypothetical protein
MLENRIWRNDLNTRVEHVLSVPVSFLMLLSPLAVFERPGGWASLPALLTALFLLLNGSFFLFLYRERGALFTLRAIFMHWFHYLYSGVGFAMGVLMFIAERLRKRPLQPV